jgi:hypothetical protein
VQLAEPDDAGIRELGATGIALHEGPDLRRLVREKRGVIEGAKLEHFKQAICGRPAPQQIRRFGQDRFARQHRIWELVKARQGSCVPRVAGVEKAD